MRHDLVAFSPDGFGNHYCFNTAEMVDGECSVVFWNHERGEAQVAGVVNSTFGDWLGEHMDWELELEAGE